MSQFQSNNPLGWGQSKPFDFAGSEPANPAIIRFFNSVYAWMAAGLCFTALVAYATSGYFVTRHGLGLGFFGLVIVQLGLVMIIGNAINRINAGVATLLFLVYAAINGFLLSWLFLAYSKGSLASAFMVTAGTFGAMSFWGMATKRDLTRLGSLAYMALIGLFIAMIVSYFYHPNAMIVAINFIGVLIFVALTAYDTQKLKQVAHQTQDNPALAARLSVVGSLMLYLDLLNLFLFILQFMDNRRRN